MPWLFRTVSYALCVMMDIDLRSLQAEVAFYRTICFSKNTKRSYASHKRAYFAFCNRTGLTPVPASTNTLCLYAAHLARRLKFNSVKQYLNIIRILHLEWQLPNPLQDNFTLNTTLRGIRRHLGDMVSRKAPITPQLLLDLLSHLDINTPSGANTWAAALLMFFGLLRRANVLPSALNSFDPRFHLRRKDLKFTSQGLQVTIRWSKTNQFRDRIHTLPLPRIPGNRLCPTQAAFHALRLTPGAPPEGPVFVSPHGAVFRPLTATAFVSQVKQGLSGHCDTSRIAGHSFRRGGASWAYSSGVPVDLIRQLGDWQSNAYTKYTLCTNNLLSSAMTLMSRELPN